MRCPRKKICEQVEETQLNFIGLVGLVADRIFSSVHSLSCVRLFATPWTSACQASLSVTNSHSLLKLKSIQSVMPSNHLILCRPLLSLPSIFPSITVFPRESALPIRVPKDWRAVSSGEGDHLLSFLWKRPPRLR